MAITLEDLRQMNDVVLEREKAMIAARSKECEAGYGKNDTMCRLRESFISEAVTGGGKSPSEAALDRMVKSSAEYIAADRAIDTASAETVLAKAVYEHVLRELAIMQWAADSGE